MQSLFRPMAFVLLLSLATALMPTSALAEPVPSLSLPASTQEVEKGRLDLYGISNSAAEKERMNQTIVISAQDRTDNQAADSVQKRENRDCCGGFWEIHFGGYRWAWWALAGAGLIAIHAN